MNRYVAHQIGLGQPPRMENRSAGFLRGARDFWCDEGCGHSGSFDWDPAHKGCAGSRRVVGTAKSWNTLLCKFWNTHRSAKALSQL